MKEKPVVPLAEYQGGPVFIDQSPGAFFLTVRDAIEWILDDDRFLDIEVIEHIHECRIEKAPVPSAADLLDYIVEQVDVEFDEDPPGLDWIPGDVKLLLDVVSNALVQAAPDIWRPIMETRIMPAGLVGMS